MPAIGLAGAEGEDALRRRLWIGFGTDTFTGCTFLSSYESSKASISSVCMGCALDALDAVADAAVVVKEEEEPDPFDPVADDAEVEVALALLDKADAGADEANTLLRCCVCCCCC